MARGQNPPQDTAFSLHPFPLEPSKELRTPLPAPGPRGGSSGAQRRPLALPGGWQAQQPHRRDLPEAQARTAAPEQTGMAGTARGPPGSGVKEPMQADPCFTQPAQPLFWCVIFLRTEFVFCVFAETGLLAVSMRYSPALLATPAALGPPWGADLGEVEAWGTGRGCAIPPRALCLPWTRVSPHT